MMMIMIRRISRSRARIMAAISPVESPELAVEAPVLPTAGKVQIRYISCPKIIQNLSKYIKSVIHYSSSL
jgi:hypothetical protein